MVGKKEWAWLHDAGASLSIAGRKEFDTCQWVTKEKTVAGKYCT